MKTVNLYKYLGENGMIISVCRLPMEYIPMVRLIAEDNKILFNGKLYTTVIDIEVVDIVMWNEIDIPDNYSD